MTSQTSRVLFVGAMLLSSVSAASANTRTSLESFTSALSVDAFVEYIRAMPWDTNSVLRDVQTLVLTAAIVDFAAFTGVFLTDLSRAMETKRGIQKTSAYILLASFSAVLFVAVIIGLRGAMVFHVWDNATNIESADRQIATRIANNTLPHMILVVAISDHDPETALNAVKSATRNIYDPQSITIYLCFNADEQTEAYLRIMQYLCKRKEHPVQGYPLRHCLEFDKIDFVLLRSRSNAQGLAYTEIRDVFKAMERRVCVVAFSADTVLYENCLFEFACGMEGRKDVVGLTGFVSGTWTNKFSIATQMRECELLSAQILRRSIEAGVGDTACVPGSLTAIRLADLNAAVRNYVAEFECANFSHLGSRQLLQHVLIRQAKTCPLGFCAKARAKAQPTRTWRKYLTQSADLLVWDTGNEAHFLCDTRLWSHAPVMQVVRLLQLTIQSTLLFFTVVLVEFAGSKLLTFSTTTVVWIPILSYWTVMLLFGLLARRVTVFLLFPMMLTIEPWINLAKILYNALEKQPQMPSSKDCSSTDARRKAADIESGIVQPAKPLTSRRADQEHVVSVAASPQGSPKMTPTRARDAASQISAEDSPGRLRPSKSMEAIGSFTALAETKGPSSSSQCLSPRPQHASSLARLVRTGSNMSTNMPQSSSAIGPAQHEPIKGSPGLRRSNSGAGRTFGKR